MSEKLQQDRSQWIRSVMDQHEPALTRYAARITGDADRARDVVQDVFLTLCREGPQNLNGKMPAWLFTVCRNRALDVIRKEKRMVVATDAAADVQTSAQIDPAHVAESKEGASRVLALLSALPANQQEVVRLRFQNGLSYKDIAAVTELSVSNVGYLIHVAIKTLRDGLGGGDHH